MLKTLRISFSMKNTYRVNSILYAIKQVPIIKKIIPDAVYSVGGFKLIANVISIIWEIVSVFLWKLIYFLFMVALAAELYPVAANSAPSVFLHIILFLTLIGSYINTYMFDADKDKYYAIILLGMDAKKYTLVNYFYAILKVILGFALCAFVFGISFGLTVWECLLIPFFAAGAKLFTAAIKLWRYERKGNAKDDKLSNRLTLVSTVLLLASAYALPGFGVIVPRFASVAVMLVFCVAGALSLVKIFGFGNYRAMYKELLDEETLQMDEQAKTNLQEQTRNSISTDMNLTSNKKGFEYLNELFIKRHRKILWQSSVKIAAVSLVIIAAVFVLFFFLPDAKVGVNTVLMSVLPYFVYVMYILNRGTGFTQALFVNCDHSLLTYSFYKQPKFILKLFWIRLREIIKINLLPAGVIGLGLAFLLFASGGTDNPLNYAVLFVSIVCLSIFFSVHYLTLYYLLQPYNAGTEIKSGTYQLIMSLTYVVCYAMLQTEVQTLMFGILTIVFCVVYCIVASILVYKFAPKTFRIRV